MAPTIPIDFTGLRESQIFSRTGLGDVMGKTRKVSKVSSTGFVPDYRHAVETVAESEDFGISSRVDAELTALQDSSVANRKSIGLTVDDYDVSVVPIQILLLSKMSPLERKDLQVRLKSELEQVRKLQGKIVSFSLDAVVHPPTSDLYSYQQGPRGSAMMDILPNSADDVPMATGKKKFAPGRNGPRSKGGAVSIRSNESTKQSLTHSTSFALLMKQCETVLTRLMGNQHAWIFNEPVDIVKHNIPDYFNVIKHPMDLGTIKRNLILNQYSHPMEFAADVRLTFKNAMTYNPPGHDVHFMAEVMSKYFEVRWRSIEKKIPPMAAQFTTSKSSIIMEPESSYVPPSAKLKTTTMENKVEHEKDKQAMSDAEKQKLGVELESLADLPDNIINFLKESTLNGSTVSEDEIEIDIDSLSDDILFTLRKMLDDYLLEKQKKQAIFQSSETEMQKESSFSKLSVQPGKDNKPADENVDVGGNYRPLIFSSPSMKIDEDTARRNSNCSRSSNNTDSENSSASETYGAKSSVPACNVNVTVENKAYWMESQFGDQHSGDCLNGHAGQNSASNSPFELNCQQGGESAQPERQVSPEKLYRAALLRSRFADIIIKAQENTIEKGERQDAEKLKLEREELETRRREEKARLQAEAKAAEETRKKAEVEAAAETKRKIELEREAARQALKEMEKTVDIDENSQYMEDLEMFRSAPDEHLQGLIEAASPESAQNGLSGSFKFRASSNPLEQLGLYMKDDDEEEEVEPESILGTSNDPEREID